MITQLLKTAAELGLSRLDAEVLLAHVLKVDRSYLYTWPEKTVETKDKEQFYSLVSRRLTGEPIAYLIGKKEFWSLPLNVSPDVLIPRPETELLVSLVLNCFPNDMESRRILELGTGSGAISLALAIERPHWTMVATDISKAALSIAQKNAKQLSVTNIQFYLGNWYEALSELPPEKKQFNVIVSNPPYIAFDDPHLLTPDITFEPTIALRSDDLGLRDIKIIIESAKDYLLSKGWLIIEHGHSQGFMVDYFLRKNHFVEVIDHKDLANVNRVTIGQKP